jgi:hypothetical protein
MLGAALPSGEVSATVTGLRSAKGQVLASRKARTIPTPGH